LDAEQVVGQYQQAVEPGHYLQMMAVQLGHYLQMMVV
jgi:hypothetical protein